MPPDSTGFLQHLLDPSQWTIVNIAAVIGTIAGVVATVLTVIQRRRPQLPEEFYTKEVIELATRYYIPPYCSTQNPTQTERPQRRNSDNPNSLQGD